MMYRYQLSRLMRGKARSLAPIISGTRKFPSTAGMEGIRKKKIITCAVHGEQLVVGVGLHQVARRSEQFQPDQQREEPADKEEERDRNQVQQRDALVVRGQQPRPDAVLLVQIFSRSAAVLLRLPLLIAPSILRLSRRLGRSLASFRGPVGGWLSDLT